MHLYLTIPRPICKPRISRLRIPRLAGGPRRSAAGRRPSRRGGGTWEKGLRGLLMCIYIYIYIYTSLSLSLYIYIYILEGAKTKTSRYFCSTQKCPALLDAAFFRKAPGGARSDLAHLKPLSEHHAAPLPLRAASPRAKGTCSIEFSNPTIWAYFRYTNMYSLCTCVCIYIYIYIHI